MNFTQILLVCTLMFSTFNGYADFFNDKVHQELTTETLSEYKKLFEENLNQIALWEAIEGLPIGQDASDVSSSLCSQQIDQIDTLLSTYFYSIQIQKLALDCHNLLDQTNEANVHEHHLINLAHLITASGDGKSIDSAFWITDLNSAYEFLKIAGLEVIDGELELVDNKTYLAVLVKSDKIFAEYRYFQLNQFFRSINQSITELIDDEDAHFLKVLNMVLKSELKNNEGLFTLAFSDITEAQILLAKLLLIKTKNYPTLYADALHFLEKASDNGSVIAKYHYAYRIFIDKLESKYTQGHELITAALSARYLPALTLAAVVREQKLGIKKDKKTVEEIISLLNEKGEPGEYELLIGRQMLNDKQWNNHKLAKKYLTLAIEKNNPEAMILYGNMYKFGLAVKQSDKKAVEWYEQATQIDKTGEAYIQLGINLVEGSGIDKDIKKATDAFITAANLGARSGHILAGALYYNKEFGQVNYQQAYNQFLQGHNLGMKSATLNLAKCLFYGHGVAQDQTKAFELFESIQKEGYFDTTIFLAVAHYNGWGTLKDPIKGVSMFRKIMLDIKNHDSNRNNLILANLNLRLAYVGNHLAVSPDNKLIDKLKLQVADKDASATFKLGYLNYMHYDANMSREKGIELLHSAANAGVAQAHNLLANYYRWENSEEKRLTHSASAEQLGDPEAIYKSADELFENNPDQAIKLYQQAAEKNLMFAINKLASLFTEGKVVTQNFQTAFSYYQQAVTIGDNSALGDILNMYGNGQISSQQLADTVAIMEADADASGSTKMMRFLAEFYANKDLPEFNPEMTIHWYLKAFEAGDKEAIIELGKRYMYGIDLRQNFELAQFFFTNATAKPTFSWADLVDEPGSFWMALMLQKGLGVEQDLEVARQIYATNFHSSRSKEAKNNYAVMTCMSKYTSNKERKEAFKIIKDLSSKSRTVMFNLGWMYEQGICTKQDSKAALAAYKISADKNSPHALYRLNQLHQQGYLVERDEQLASDYRQRSINASKKITFHNMMSTFIDLPYIKNLQMAVPEEIQASLK